MPVEGFPLVLMNILHDDLDEDDLSNLVFGRFVENYRDFSSISGGWAQIRWLIDFARRQRQLAVLVDGIRDLNRAVYNNHDVFLEAVAAMDTAGSAPDLKAPRPRILVRHLADPLEASSMAAQLQGELGTKFELVYDNTSMAIDAACLLEQFCDWMEEAQGAILMLSGTAFERQFLPIEGSVYSWKICRGHRFTFLPIVLDGPAASYLAAGVHSELAKTALRFDNATNHAERIKIIAERLEYLRDAPEALVPSNRAEERVTEHLEDGKASRADLIRAGNALNAPVLEWNSIEIARKELAKHLVHCSHDLLLEAIRSLRESMAKEHLCALYQIAAPTWVELRASRPIAEQALHPVGPRLLALNARTERTVEMYLRRACRLPDPPSFPVFVLSTHAYTLDSIRTEIEAFVRRKLNMPQDDGSEKIRLCLEEFYKEISQPIVVVVCMDRVDETLAHDLRNEFGTITFLFLTSREGASISDRCVRNLEPPLAPDAEEHFLLKWKIINEI